MYSRRAAFVCALFACFVVPRVAAAQFSIEGFESAAEGATTRSLVDVDVALTGQLAVRTSALGDFGADPSKNWIGTPTVAASGLVGSIESTTAGVGFEVKSVYAWTSNNAGGADTPGPVTFTGILPGGGTVSETFAVTPTGFLGTDYDVLVFDSATWGGVTLVELEVTLGTGINYVALDLFEYRAVTISPCSPNPCENAGVCSVAGGGTFTCDCAGTGYSGATCTTNVDDCTESSCDNGGVCIDGVNAITCDCAGTGYSGTTCSVPLPQDAGIVHDDAGVDPGGDAGVDAGGDTGLDAGVDGGYGGETDGGGLVTADAGPDGSVAPIPGDAGGCGCSVPGSAPVAPSSLVVGLGVLVVLVRRSRRRH
jgi:MYXO-CTERM domain-containing protein